MTNAVFLVYNIFFLIDFFLQSVQLIENFRELTAQFAVQRKNVFIHSTFMCVWLMQYLKANHHTSALSSAGGSIKSSLSVGNSYIASLKRTGAPFCLIQSILFSFFNKKTTRKE